MISNQLESLLPRILAWPEDAQHKLVGEIREIEAQLSRICSRSSSEPTVKEQGSTDVARSGLVANDEADAYFKRHCWVW